MRKITLTVVFLFLIAPFLTNERILAEDLKKKIENRQEEKKAFRETLSEEEKTKLQKKAEYIAERIKDLTPEGQLKLIESSLISSTIIKNLTSDEKERLKYCYENWINTLTSIPLEDRNQLKHNLLYLVK